MVTCPNCETQNIDGVRFCVQCGTALAPPLESWRGTGETAAPENPTTPPPSSDPQGTGGGYTPPYAAPSYATSQSPPPPPSFGAPLPAMSYGTHAPTSFGGGTMQYAEWGQRVLGSLIDGVIGMVIYMVIAIPFGILSNIGGSDPNELSGLQCFGTGLAYAVGLGFGIFNQIWLRGTRGSTIGQGVMNLKTVTAEGEIPSFGALIIRLLVQIPIGFVLCIGPLIDVLFPLWDEKKQTLHDKVASTFVVKT